MSDVTNTLHDYVGAYAKIRHSGQRMWWKLLAIEGDQVRVELNSTPATHIEWQPGVLDELPIQCDLKPGDVMTFPASEIMDVHTGAPNA